MSNTLYLGDAFGWDTDATAKVAICQLRQQNKISTTACPKAQLIKNESYRGMPNTLKILGYIPLVNVVAGVVAIIFSENGPELRPHNKMFWVCRGVAMIFTGPLLAIVDLVKYIFDSRTASKFQKEHKKLIEQFDTTHKHTPAYWPGHPVFCTLDAEERQY